MIINNERFSMREITNPTKINGYSVGDTINVGSLYDHCRKSGYVPKKWMEHHDSFSLVKIFDRHTIKIQAGNTLFQVDARFIPNK